MASLGRLKSTIFDKEERKMQYQSHIRGLNAYDRHKKFMKDYVQFYGHTKNVDNSLPIKTDKDTLREGYRFILSEEDDMDSTWEKRLVKRYYDKLFKEYCIADMTQYKKGKGHLKATIVSFQFWPWGMAERGGRAKAIRLHPQTTAQAAHHCRRPPQPHLG
uniref:Predicted protein n=1 Tax=Hordeum vulgare subsp. vulgare TaxID=112509 RepID=F2DID3_HORVV|nr:predicted protein [Hordeum vulgare subsp. vulgare]